MDRRATPGWMLSLALSCVALTAMACGLDLLGEGNPTRPEPELDASTSSSSSSGTVDANIVEADVAESTGCDPTKDFSAPILVPGLSSPVLEESHVTLSGDELTAWLIIGSGDGREIHVATRASRADAFNPPVPVTTLSSPTEEDNVTVTADGLVLFFASRRPGVGSFDLWTSSRPTTASEFALPTIAAGPNTPFVDGDPFIIATGAAIYFDSDRSLVDKEDIYVSRRSATGELSAPAPVTELNLPDGRDRQPVVSADERTIIFTSERAPSVESDLWIATRSSATAPFENITHLASQSTDKEDFATWLSADGCVLYTSNAKAGTRDIYRSERPVRR